jgi:hydrogenase expression/formation protein HypC
MCLAIPGKVLLVEGSIATLDLQGRQVKADASMVSVKPGDFVVVYAGLIVQTLDEEEARERLRILADGETDSNLDA